MVNSDSGFHGGVAEFYDSTLVPMIFEPYAEDLAARAHSLAPQALLEIACGTGAATRALAERLPEGCLIHATDLNQAMVDRGLAVGTARPVTWGQADVMDLPFEDASFDAVVCQFGVMFFPDRVAAFQEIRRVLRPGGSFLFSAWNAIEENDFALVVSDTMRALYPADPPAFLSRTPHGHGDPENLEAEVRAAGFGECLCVQKLARSPAGNPEVPALAYCHGTPLRNELEERGPDELATATAAVVHALRTKYGDGPFEGQLSAVIVECRST
ncbi:MAG: class I SAM-dependent methyltransferase [Planctomycetota bacterium]|jgi:ubiquinone/menaquinone biosynthesis C-methylase UbiE